MSRSVVFLFALIMLVACFTVTEAQAQKKPIQISLVTPIQIFPPETDIAGLRLNILYGRNASVTGIDIGLVNHTTSGISKGWQYGLVGLNDADFVGFQDNFVNITQGDFEGFQLGFVNYVNNGNGLMLGFVNYARTMKGLQIGLVNVIKQGGQFPVFPIVNWSF